LCAKGYDRRAGLQLPNHLAWPSLVPLPGRKLVLVIVLNGVDLGQTPIHQLGGSSGTLRAGQSDGDARHSAEVVGRCRGPLCATLE
jgi:hypothetical protein